MIFPPMHCGSVCSCMCSHTISLAHLVWKEWCWHQEIKWNVVGTGPFLQFRCHSSNQKNMWAQTPFSWNKGQVENSDLQFPNVISPPWAAQQFSCTWQNPIGEDVLQPSRVQACCLCLGNVCWHHMAFTAVFYLGWHIMPHVKFGGKLFCMKGLVFCLLRYVCVCLKLWEGGKIIK